MAQQNSVQPRRRRQREKRDAQAEVKEEEKAAGTIRLKQKVNIFVVLFAANAFVFFFLYRLLSGIGKTLNLSATSTEKNSTQSPKSGTLFKNATFWLGDSSGTVAHQLFVGEQGAVVDECAPLCSLPATPDSALPRGA